MTREREGVSPVSTDEGSDGTDVERDEDGWRPLNLCCSCMEFVRCWDECLECDCPVCIDCSELITLSEGVQGLLCRECYDEVPYSESDDDEDAWRVREPLCDVSNTVDNSLANGWRR